MTALDDLRPRAKPNVMDLVAAAGLDVEPWRFKASGVPVKTPASNGKYCYEWSFVDPDRAVVFNIWYGNLQLHGDTAVYEMNPREIAAYVMREPGITTQGRQVVAGRARKLDQAIRLAWEQGLPVRVIVNDGLQRKQGDAANLKSAVKKRLLDPTPWAVVEYNAATGSTRLERGAEPPKGELIVDQFSAEPEVETKLREVHGMVYERQRAIRDHALRRAKGRCELCGEAGFVTQAGQRYLETHHIVPLSKGGGDSTSNVVALCANDHRRAHVGVDLERVRTSLLAVIAVKVDQRRAARALVSAKYGTNSSSFSRKYTNR